MNPMVFTILAAERQLAERQQAAQQAARTAWEKPATKTVALAAQSNAQPRPQPLRNLLPWTRSKPAHECSEPC